MWYINRHDDSPPRDIACCVEERRKQVQAFGDCIVRVIEQLLRERDHRLRRRESQVGRVEVTEADAVKAVGVLQQRHKRPVGIVDGRLIPIGFAVQGHGPAYRWLLIGIDAGRTQVRRQAFRRSPLLHRVGTVTQTDAVVRPSQVVQINRRPQASRPLVPTRGLEQSERMNHHSRDVSLPVNAARVCEQVGCGNQFGRCHAGNRRRSEIEAYPTDTPAPAARPRPPVPARHWIGTDYTQEPCSVRTEHDSCVRCLASPPTSISRPAMSASHQLLKLRHQPIEVIQRARVRCGRSGGAVGRD